MSLGDKIKNARTKKAYSQAELANKIGVSQSAIYYWENGKREPSIETIKKIATALDTNIVSLIGYEDYCDLIAEKKENAFLEYLSSIGYEFEYGHGYYDFIIRRNNEEYIISEGDYYKLYDNIKKFSDFTIEQLLSFADKKD